MGYYKYCPKCGEINFIDSITNCHFCNEPYVITDYKWSLYDGDRNMYKIILEEYANPKPLFDE